MGQAAVDLPDPLEKPKPAPVGSADELLAQLAGDEIDRLLADADADTPAAPVAAAPAPVIVAEPAPVAEVPVEHHEETETDHSERSALAADDVARQSADLLNGNFNVPFFLKPLVWLNRPLDGYSDQARETIGKIAVLTMVNAIAVLAYVVIYRRHH